MKAIKPKHFVEPRPSTEPPVEIVRELMGVIRGQFYGDANGRTWARDSHYIEYEVVLWPASWLKERGLTMTPKAYRQMLLEKLNDVKRHCAQATFRYLPAYIRGCIRDHFEKNEDRIHRECKAAAGSVDAVLSKLPAPVADPIWALADAHQVLARKRFQRKKPAAKAAAVQGELL